MAVPTFQVSKYRNRVLLYGVQLLAVQAATAGEQRRTSGGRLQFQVAEDLCRIEWLLHASDVVPTGGIQL